MNVKRLFERVISYFKRDPREFVALICAACIAVVSFLTASFPAFATSGGGSGLIRGSQPLEYIDAVNYFSKISGLSSYYIYQYFEPENYGSAYGYKFINKNHREQVHYFWKDENGSIQYRFVDESEDSSPVMDGDSSSTTITGKELKELKDYWSDYYQPHENAQQFIWSYQTRGCTSESPYSLGSPDCPIYMDTHGNWGGKNWDSFYFMLFYTDDSVGTYYSSRYIRCYPLRENDSVYICFDLYDLESGSFIRTEKTGWDVVNYPYFSVYHSISDNVNALVLPYFTSYSNYISDKSSYHFSGVSVGFGTMVNTSYVQSNSCLSAMRQSVNFTPNTNKNDDWGFICSSEPFQLFGSQTSIDYDKIPDNYTITINGDTIYDYDITNPDTGKTTKITNYITNNYTIPDDGGSSGDSGSGGSGSGTVSGNVTVGGKVDVSGKIEIDTKPIDININVNGGSGSSSSGEVPGAGEASGVEFDQDVSLNNYYDWMQEQTTGFSGFMKQFFSWLPEPIVIMLCAGFALVILARFLGR